MTEAATDTKPLIGPKIALMGLGGTGKTYALGTLAEWAERNGFELAILFTENSLETFLGYFRDPPPDSKRVAREPPACIYWHQQLTRPVSLKAMTSMADSIGKLSYESITKLADANRGENNAFWRILASCADFVDDRTGKKLGPVDSFPANRIFAMDSLTETSNAAMKMQVGARPTASPGDYGVAQGALMNFLRLCTQGINCPFIMTAHVDRELEPVSGLPKTMIKAVGKALATEIPTLFSEMIYTVREGNSWYWDQAAFGVDVKSRYLPYRTKITPDLGQIMDAWKKRSGA